MAERINVMSITIRRYMPADTQPIMQLFHDTVHAINIRDYSPEQIDAWAPPVMDEQRWKQRLSDHHTFVAEIDGVIVGFADFEDNGHLDCFYCHKDYQGVGVGKRLLAALEAEAQTRGIGRFFTEASITARPFFERHGFVVIQEQHVLHNGVTFTNYRMEKWLDLTPRS
jgi:putative acetyltransferase